MSNRRLTHEEKAKTSLALIKRLNDLDDLKERLAAETAQLEIIKLNRLVTKYQTKHQIKNGEKTIRLTNQEIGIEEEVIKTMQYQLTNGVPNKK